MLIPPLDFPAALLGNTFMKNFAYGLLVKFTTITSMKSQIWHQVDLPRYTPTNQRGHVKKVSLSHYDVSLLPFSIPVPLDMD